MGGAVALRLALRRPERVASLVLAAPAGIRSSTDEARRMLWIVGLVQPGRRIAPYRRRFAASPVGRWLAFWHWGAADPVALDPEIAEAFLAGPGLHTDTWTAWQALVVEDLRGELEALRCPVLVVWGAEDNQLPLEDGVEYARRLRAPLRVIPDCGHLLIGERPDACLDAIVEFLARGTLADGAERHDLGLLRRRREEVDSMGHDLDGAPALAVLLPRTAAQPAVDADLAALREVLGAQLGLPVPGVDPDEVGVRVLPRTLDGEQEARDLLVRADVAQLDLGCEMADQRDDVHGGQRSEEGVTCLRRLRDERRAPTL
jgi:hypothetical protein